MNVIADRPEARLLPSRHHFAIARLVAFLRLQLRADGRSVETPEHLILPIDRDQSSAEIYAIATWVFLTTASYFACLLPLPLPLALLAAIPLAFIAIHIPIVVGGPLVRLLAGEKNHVRTISAITMGALLISSLYIARTATWARVVAWLFLTVVAGNAIAAVILWMLRGRVQAAEKRCAE
ncbi:MAG: hypothetical protein QOC81_4909 [Thermoanaerobaculia bacterium]|jgi:hypothetical protein|nr:hypothetical protein [Thermoanaerobaculia bacterium]